MRLTTEGLTHRFTGQQPLFENLSLTLSPGGLTALMGPSGSGKTTLLTILAGWVLPTSGTITRDGVDHIAWVAQNPHGVTKRTALDHVVLPLLTQGLRRRDAETRAGVLLTEFHLAAVAGRLFRHLSGGEAGRLMLACAVAANPDLLLVDEPTAQLDPVSATRIIDVLGGLADSGRIVLVATHDNRVRRACHTVITLGGTR
jgi:ABC-type multidrug transport system ATPase subunit